MKSPESINSEQEKESRLFLLSQLDIFQEYNPDTLSGMVLSRASDKLAGANMSVINEAIDVATEGHGGQKRKVSGAPFVIHPLQTALIGIELYSHNTGPTQIDPTKSVISNLLHDFPEDSKPHNPQRYEDSLKEASRFGSDIREGVNALSKIRYDNGQRKEIADPDFCLNIIEADRQFPQLGVFLTKISDNIVNLFDALELKMLNEQEMEIKKKENENLRRRIIKRTEKSRIPNLFRHRNDLHPLINAAVELSKETLEPSFNVKNWENELENNQIGEAA
jgi:(p)ppGpp synthase/HD superfamily hydrolase